MELLDEPTTEIIIIINNTILILIVDYQTRGSPILWVQTGRAPHVSRWTPPPWVMIIKWLLGTNLIVDHQGAIVNVGGKSNF